MRSKVAVQVGSGGDESRPSSGWPHLQDVLVKGLCLTVHLIVSVSLGCAESEVHGLLCASVSGLPLGKDGENRGGGLLRGFVSALVGGYTPNAPPQSLLRLGSPASWAQPARLSPLHPLPVP